MSWQKEFSESLKNIDDLKSFFNRDFSESHYPIFIPISLAKKIKDAGENSPLWKQFMPHQNENQANGRIDPIGDIKNSKGHQIIHRYKNRVLFTPTTVCPVLCRYCFRKNELSSHHELFSPDLNLTLKFLKDHPEINEVIFTGGDPLILSNEKLAFYLQSFSEIETIKFVRFHTRTPVIIPSRIDEGFLNVMLSSKALFKRSLLMIHINHADEIDNDFIRAINLLTENNIEVYSQTVLLKGVNDKTETLYDLFLNLAEIGIRPYYLHHPDEALGAMHFHLTLEAGRKIVWPLHDQLPGWAIPQYVIDIPGGEGKVPALNSESFKFSGKLLNRKAEEIPLTSF